jgi:hypothetical protein
MDKPHPFRVVHPNDPDRTTGQSAAEPPSGNAKAPARAKELCLRFSCPSCARVVSAPLERMGQEEACPGCRTRFEIPYVDPGVNGFEVARGFVFAFMTPPPQAPLRGKPAHAEGAKPTTASSTTPQPTAAAPIDSTAQAQHHTDSGFADFLRGPAGNQPNSNGPQIVVTAPTIHHRHIRQIPSLVNLLGRYPRMTRRVVGFTTWLGPPALVFAMKNPGEMLVILAIVWFLWGYHLFRHIIPVIMALIVPRASCPYCYEFHDLAGVWNCACGYRDHRVRHFYLYRCPSCSSRLGHFNCPRCHVTILM